MKTLKTIFSIALISFFANSAFAGKDSTIVIKTSAQCESCEKRIENALNFEKGVKSGKLDLKTKSVTVVFDSEKTTSDKIRKAIANTGYDADNIPADAKAYKKLPGCCQKGGKE